MFFSDFVDDSYIDRVSRFVEVETSDELSMFNFIDELKSSNIYEQLTQRVDGNPQANYDIFSHLLSYAKDKHLPKNS